MARLSFADYQSTRYFFPLDGLRAISAALVVTWHTRDQPLEFLQGERGVTVFFVLSGYLITMLALREEEAKGELSIKGFFLRRVFRILPLYYIVLAAYAVLVYTFDTENTADFNESLPYFLLYLSEVPLLLNEIAAPFNHSWSLGIEEKFYVVWPFLAFGLMKHSRLRLPMSLILGGGLLIAGGFRPEFGQPVALIEPYGHILIGAAMAFALHNKRWFERLGFLQNASVYWLLGLACVVLGVIEDRWAFELLAVPTALFVGAMVLQPRHTISKALGFGPLAWLGTLSYAIYLIHPAVLSLGERLIPAEDGRLDDIVTLLIGYALSIAIAVLLHRLIEKPFIKWGRKFDKSRQPAPAAATAPVIDLTDSPDGQDTEAAVNADAEDAEDSEDPEDSDVEATIGSVPVATARGVDSSAMSDVSLAPVAPVAPAVTWGTNAWVEARGSATVRRSSAGAVALKSSPITQVQVLPAPEQQDVLDLRDREDHQEPEEAETNGGSAVPGLAPTEPVAPEPPGPVPEESPRISSPDTDVAGSKSYWPILGLLGVLAIGALVALGYVFATDSTANVQVPVRIDDVRVDGNTLVDSAGAPLRLQGVTQGGAQYACAQGWGIFDGAADASSAEAMSAWGVNAVRLPLNQHCWLGTQGFAAEFSGQNYRTGIVDYVDVLRSQGHAVVLSLDWSGTGADPSGQGILPTAEFSTRFWESVVAEVGDRDGLVFELFASPDSSEGACISQGCSIDGTDYIGFQGLIDTIRRAGGRQPLVLTAPAPGLDVSFAEDLAFVDPLDQLIVGFKAVDGSRDAINAGCTGLDCWSAAAEAASVDNADALMPTLAIELGTANCSAEDYEAALERLASGGVSVFVSGWNTWDACGTTPGLLANDQYEPTPVGQAIRSSYTR